MRGSLAELEARGAQLLAVDPHDAESAQFLLREAGFATDDVHYPLLMDPSQTVSAQYGVAFQMRIHTEWSNRPGTFIIDEEGTVRYIRRGTTFADRPGVDEILAELDKLRD